MMPNQVFRSRIGPNTLADMEAGPIALGMWTMVIRQHSIVPSRRGMRYRPEGIRMQQNDTADTTKNGLSARCDY